MKKDPASEADGLNHDETKGDVRTALEASDRIDILGDYSFALLRGRPKHPIRRRGYYRALKREEPWALVEEANSKATKEMFMEFVERMNRPSIFMSLIRQEKDK